MIGRAEGSSSRLAAAIVLTLIKAAAQTSGPASSFAGSVGVSPSSFNPSARESVTLSFTLQDNARTSVAVIGPDRRVVKQLLSSAPGRKGPQKIVWDGRDYRGRIVPNESFYFRIVAQPRSGAEHIFDPVEFSGGEFGDITTGSISRRAGTISYQLSQPSRVLIRAGVPGSALFKTVVDWEPRKEGSVTEYWNGRDESNLVDVLSMKDRRIIVSYFTLPVSSVIATGNSKYTFREYQAATKPLPAPLPFPPLTNSRRISPHFTKDRTIDRSFQVNVSFPEVREAQDPPSVNAKDKLVVQLDIPAADRDVIAGQQFEIILFIDSKFYTEEERGYVPFRYPLDISRLDPGEHVVTVNVITFGDQVGIGSRRIRVVR